MNGQCLRDGLLRVMWLLFLGAALILSSCREEDDNPNDPGNPQPSQFATVSGTVADQNQTPLADAALHLVYELPALQAGAARPAIPSQTLFYTFQVLTTECGGSTPLPDGIPVRIIWDSDSDGPDETDQPPPLCDEPPACATGPLGTVNLNEFQINGESVGLAPGTFYMERALTTALDVLTPNRYYLRIYCGDGGIFYTSNVLDVPGGPSEYEVTFTCTACEDAPEVPAWSFEQGYPNPATDSVAIRFGLEQGTDAAITLIQYGTDHEFPLLSGTLPSGGHFQRFDIRDRANGLYDVRMRAGGYSEHHLLLKNTDDIASLRSTPAYVLSDTQGRFTLQTAAEIAIDRRGTEGQNHGSALLSRLRVIALKSGYQPRDTVFDIVGGGSYSVNLSLFPE